MIGERCIQIRLDMSLKSKYLRIYISRFNCESKMQAKPLQSIVKLASVPSWEEVFKEQPSILWNQGSNSEFSDIAIGYVGFLSVEGLYRLKKKKHGEDLVDSGLR
jgi:hypothetical protein